jgi:glycosyltransferase involved in cell wall biosynthesis
LLVPQHIAFLSSDGLTDPLGQSQILPYLIGLTSHGYRFSIISCEKKAAFERLLPTVQQQLDDLTAGTIRWIPIPYQTKPPLIGPFRNVHAMRKALQRLHQHDPVCLTHCRSYLAAWIGLRAKQASNIPFLFDMRGFWADERVEGGIWPQHRWHYRQLYTYFKHQEKHFFKQANGIISLTHTAAHYIQTHFKPQCPISVIPCCVDTQFFAPENVPPTELQEWKARLNITDAALVLGYIGSTGTWYCSEAMLGCFRELLSAIPNAQFLWVTHTQPAQILALAQRQQIPEEAFRFVHADRAQMPALISCMDAGISFIQPSWSKQASSPTKIAEYLAMGKPIIANPDIGDLAQLLNQQAVGVSVPQFDACHNQQAIAQLLPIAQWKAEAIRAVAVNDFDLGIAIDRYAKMYQMLSG